METENAINRIHGNNVTNTYWEQYTTEQQATLGDDEMAKHAMDKMINGTIGDGNDE